MPATTTHVVRGVSGAGKTTPALELVRLLGWDYAEGDDFHPAANVEKMRAGHPLDDDDRWPWLRAFAAWTGVHERGKHPAIVTCSALSSGAIATSCGTAIPRVLRTRLRIESPASQAGGKNRKGHNMRPSLLDGQLETLETLEPLESDGPGIRVSADAAPDVVAEHVLTALRTAGHAFTASQKESP